MVGTASGRAQWQAMGEYEFQQIYLPRGT
ncbi:MAG: hypothetical protein QOE40_3304, partial [Actinomycetota bacterium]|nr:hypothetical protein [Actinomycetota bacterium]